MPKGRDMLVKERKRAEADAARAKAQAEEARELRKAEKAHDIDGKSKALLAPVLVPTLSNANDKKLRKKTVTIDNHASAPGLPRKWRKGDPEESGDTDEDEDDDEDDDDDDEDNDDDDDDKEEEEEEEGDKSQGKSEGKGGAGAKVLAAVAGAPRSRANSTGSQAGAASDGDGVDPEAGAGTGVAPAPSVRPLENGKGWVAGAFLLAGLPADLPLAGTASVTVSVPGDASFPTQKLDVAFEQLHLPRNKRSAPEPARSAGALFVAEFLEGGGDDKGADKGKGGKAGAKAQQNDAARAWDEVRAQNPGRAAHYKAAAALDRVRFLVQTRQFRAIRDAAPGAGSAHGHGKK